MVGRCARVALPLALLLVLSAAPPAGVVGAQDTCVPPSGQQVIVYHAGSLTAAFTSLEQTFTCRTGIQVQPSRSPRAWSSGASG